MKQGVFTNKNKASWIVKYARDILHKNQNLSRMIQIILRKIC